MSNWSKFKLDHFADVLDHLRIPVNEEERSINPGTTPYYGANGLQGYINGYLFDEPLILIAEDGGYFDDYATRPVAYKISGKSWINNHAHILRPKDFFDFDYVFYHLQHKNITAFIKGGTRAKLNQKELREIEIYAPVDKDKQQKIAKILSTIDRTITHTEALIEKYQQIKAGLMHDLFTRGIGADGKLRPPRDKAPELYQESSIGWIPKEWQLELLDKLAQRGSGHTPNKNIGGYWNGGVKWVSLADSRKLDKLYISDTDLEISELGIQNSSANIHPSGTVIMTRDAGVGKSAIMSEPMAVSQHFMVWRCAEKMNNYFLYYWLQYKKRMFENVAMGSTIVTIGLPYFKRLKIAAPISIGEQTIISEKLRSTDTHIFSLKSELEKLKYKKSGLMHDLLTGTVQVNIDPV